VCTTCRSPKRTRSKANLEQATADPRIAIAPTSYWAAHLGQQVDVWTQQINRYLMWMEIAGQAPSTLDGEAERCRLEVLREAPSLEQLAQGQVECLEPLLAVARTRNHARSARLARPRGRRVWTLSLAGRRNARRVGRVGGRPQTLGDEMDMQFLYDEDRKLFHIGFSVDELRLDASYYDLLASECRIASFATIARGEIPVEHWVTLGRRFSNCAGRAAMMSWSGTMFEYLMPLLLMRAYQNSLLDMAARNAVLCRSITDASATCRGAFPKPLSPRSMRSAFINTKRLAFPLWA
jgi:cyclic beta-1,2-glucan synthetase